MTMIRLTMAQALTRYLAAQTSEVDGREVPLFAGAFAYSPYDSRIEQGGLT